MVELKKLLKNRNNRLMLVILIIGAVIIILSAGFDGNPDKGQVTDSYAREEERLSKILSEINGAGRVLVMISYEDEYNAESSIGRGFTDTELQQKPRGVIVVAEGARSPAVRNALKEATVAVMGVGANRVVVYASNK